MWIKWSNDSEHIVLSNQYSLQFGTQIPPKTKFHFGSFETERELTLSPLLTKETIVLPISIKLNFMIPDTLPYDLRIDENGLHLGPVIAILTSRVNVSPGIRTKYLEYLWDYKNLQGLIYLCPLEGINPAKTGIEGYYYQPDELGSAGIWKKGVFPYPNVVYRRIGVNRNDKYDHLLVTVGQKIFNPSFLDKWAVWKALQDNPKINPHLPKTALLRNAKEVICMLKDYGSVYLKPVSGSFGRGIVKIELTNKGYLWKHKNTKKKLSQKKLIKILCYQKRRRAYLFQQSVSLKVHNKHVDFRVIMQKNNTQTWNCTGIIARYGMKGKHYTNDVSALKMGVDGLKNALNLNDQQIKLKTQEILSLCTLVCENLDELHGPYADLGLDVAIDTNYKVWLLEINFRHMHNIAALVGQQSSMYSKVITRPLEFAKAFAGYSTP